LQHSHSLKVEENQAKLADFDTVIDYSVVT